MDQEAKNYEIAYLISPDITNDEVFGVAGKITEYIQNAGGMVKKVEEPRMKKLAFPIEKKQNAYFGWTTFLIKAEAIDTFKKKLGFEEKRILRFLVVNASDESSEAVHRLRQWKYPPIEKHLHAEQKIMKEQERINVAEIDKKLEEILNK